MKKVYIKENVKSFIGAVVDNKHKLAHTILKSIINKKIKQKIINNNSNIF